VTRARFAAGTVLMRADEIGREFLVVADGTLGVSGGTDGDVMPRSLLGPGDFVGELALLGGGTRTATVTTLTAVTAYVCTPREFSALLDAAPSVRGRVLAAAFQRLAGATSVGGGSVPDGADDLP
jgi:CRP-like cAMP-binding protein